MLALDHPRPNTRRALREPLYTFAEIAERLGVSAGRVLSLMGHYPGLDYVRSTPGGIQIKVHTRLYRLSVARAWWNSLPPHRKEAQ